MGNPLSPLRSDCFMSAFERKITFWCRYVDEINEMLYVLNDQVKSKIDNLLEFEIYHKPTSTKRILTNYSFCPVHYIRTYIAYVKFHRRDEMNCTLLQNAFKFE